ncbi:anti-sigma factor family protein [Streptomyces profundus]|uniref:anti-sigma factor family protein n=1 Tax=Streptomyces profundus TaxID=2867410 RepID=UPI001D1605A1|nr:zf-HC2 domain-containing protein [Streptomyces sp. MA3_2.13]UED84338.1 zf-HC2 domain-containing protein [Streptomyces sp. MA3_2.13]
MTAVPESGPADRHLGESLAALVDGELSHDRRDRVLAHLATCAHCKTEAEAQRRLKSAFAASPLPGPSAGLLARLQNVPAESVEPTRSIGEGPPPPGEDGPPSAGTPPKRSSAFRLDMLPGGRGRSSLLPPASLGGDRGFRIHESPVLGRANRGHRIAFAAAGAVSLAAFAIGGAVSNAGAGGPAVTASAPSTITAGSGVAPGGGPRPMTARADDEGQAAGALRAQPVADGGPAAPSASPVRHFTLLGSSLPADHGPSPVPEATPPVTTASPLIGPLRPEHTTPSALGAVSPR